MLIVLRVTTVYSFSFNILETGYLEGLSEHILSRCREYCPNYKSSDVWWANWFGESIESWVSRPIELRVVPLAHGKIMNHTAARIISVAKRVIHTARVIMFRLEPALPLLLRESASALAGCDPSTFGLPSGSPWGLSVIHSLFIKAGSKANIHPSPILSPQRSAVFFSQVIVSAGPYGRIFTRQLPNQRMHQCRCVSMHWNSCVMKLVRICHWNKMIGITPTTKPFRKRACGNIGERVSNDIPVCDIFFAVCPQ